MANRGRGRVSADDCELLTDNRRIGAELPAKAFAVLSEYVMPALLNQGERHHRQPDEAHRPDDGAQIRNANVVHGNE